MVLVERPVRFEEVDAAGILFSAHFLAYAHEAMELLFAALPGGYPGLIIERRIGFPGVKTECGYTAPLRYGQMAVIEGSVERLGNRSVDLSFAISRKSDDAAVATVRHTVVVTDLQTLKSCDMPEDVRAALSAHLR